MPERNLRMVRFTYPMTGVCEQCNARFLSRNEDLDVAAQHIHEQFEAHQCELGNREGNRAER